MYKLLLTLKYLRTRYIALASVISVTLGVATMIVVNSVMEGFTREMQGRIHGILSDVVFEGHNLEGFYDAQAHMAQIRKIAGPYIAGMTPTVAVPGQLALEVDGHWQTRHVTFIGVDRQSYGQVSDFNRYLKHPANRQQLDFALRAGGYEIDGAPDSGWAHRRKAELRQQAAANAADKKQAPAAARPPNDQAADEQVADEQVAEAIEIDGWKFHRLRKADPDDDQAPPAVAAANPFAKLDQQNAFDPNRDTHTGIVLGIGLARVADAVTGERFLVQPGDDVKVTVPTAATPPKAASDTFTIVDFYESQMTEYDANFIFVPLDQLQKMRGMIDPQTGVGYVTSILIRLHNDADGTRVRDMLREAFPGSYYGVQTWRDKQGPLLAAVQMQRAILNLLLLLIIAVSGFGILAIFCMIVAEKTRDIGILKSLGAPWPGLFGIFVSYGLSLGIVGSGAGLAIGLVFVANINRIADLLARLTGREVFDPTIYYFQEIPTIVEPLTVAWIVFGAMAIAVMASILPACRAARLHPVEALRHE